jgi:hypothetical protein
VSARDLSARITSQLIAAIEADPGKPALPWRRSSGPLFMPVVSTRLSVVRRSVSSPVRDAASTVLRYVVESESVAAAAASIAMVRAELAVSWSASAVRDWSFSIPEESAAFACSAELATCSLSASALSESVPATFSTLRFTVPAICSPVPRSSAVAAYLLPWDGLDGPELVRRRPVPTRRIGAGM